VNYRFAPRDGLRTHASGRRLRADGRVTRALVIERDAFDALFSALTGRG
jgi:hypothetical protein